MSTDQAERFLFELEKRTVRLEDRVGRLSTSGMMLMQRAANQERLRVAGTVYNTIYGKQQWPSTVVRILGCNGGGVPGITVTFKTLGGTTLATADTDSDGYASYVDSTLATTRVFEVSAYLGYSSNNGTVTSGSSATLQLLPQSGRLCFAACSSPVLTQVAVTSPSTDFLAKPTVSNAATPTASSFRLSVAPWGAHIVNGALCQFLTGSLSGESQYISSWNAGTSAATVATAFSGAPSVGDVCGIQPIRLQGESPTALHVWGGYFGSGTLVNPATNTYGYPGTWTFASQAAYARIYVPATVTRFTWYTGNARALPGSTTSAGYSLEVFLGRDTATGDVRVSCWFRVMVEVANPTNIVAPIVDSDSSSAGSSGTHNVVLKHVDFLVTSYPCDTLALTIDTTGTELDTLLGITSLGIG